MKKHDLLFLIIFCFALFDTQCSEEQNSNFFNVLPPEITERIFFLIFANADDPFPFTFTTQRVCWAWRNLVLKSENTAQFLMKYKEKKNKEFFDNYKDHISGYGDHDNPPDYNFFDHPVFNLETIPHYVSSGFEHCNFDAVAKLIKKDDKVLNDFLLNSKWISTMVNWDCVCACEHIVNKCCARSSFREYNQKIIIDYIASRGSFVSDEARRNIFDTFILPDQAEKFCMLKRLLPVFRIEESGNSEYYFKSILGRIAEIEKVRIQRWTFEDKRLNQYLLILFRNNANFSSLGSQKEAFREQILNIKHFFATKETLESILGKQRQ